MIGEAAYLLVIGPAMSLWNKFLEKEFFALLPGFLDDSGWQRQLDNERWDAQLDRGGAS